MLFSLSVASTSAALNTPCIDIEAPSGACAKVLEVAVMLTAAPVSYWALGWTPNLSTQSGSIQLMSEEGDYSKVSQATVSTTWSVAPLVPVQFLRRISVPANAGAGAIWTFLRGLALPPNGVSAVIWNVALNSNPAYVNFVIDE